MADQDHSALPELTAEQADAAAIVEGFRQGLKAAIVARFGQDQAWVVYENIIAMLHAGMLRDTPEPVRAVATNNDALAAYGQGRIRYRVAELDRPGRPAN